MSTKCVSSCANVFMGWFEEKFISASGKRINMFLIWNGTKSEFENFLKKNNECHANIKNRNQISQHRSIQSR